MYNYSPEKLEELLHVDQVETNELLLENMSEDTKLNAQMLTLLVDCEPSIY